MKPLPSIKISVSQVEKFEECPRKWGFERLFDLHEPGSRYGMTFGTVLHGVLERYLSADDHGRDPLTGKPILLYPPGWQWDLMSRHRIQPEHDDLIKRLVDQAIQKGVLKREPGREVEREFWLLAAPPPSMIVVQGFKDVESPGKIGDHKSTKTMKYAKSAANLWHNLQLGVYAHEQLVRDPALQVVQVEHYQYDWVGEKVKTTAACRPPLREATYFSSAVGFGGHVCGHCSEPETAHAPKPDLTCPGPPRGKVIETYKPGLTRAQAQLAWDRLVRAGKDMQACYTVKDPFQLPAAKDGAGAGPGACSAYGGCGFWEICSKGTVQEFARVRDRLALKSLPREVVEDMSDLKKALGKKKALVLDDDEDAASPAAKKKAPWAEEEEEEEEPAAEPEAEEEPAPPPKAKAKAAPKAKAPPVTDEAEIGGALMIVTKATLMKLPHEELAERLCNVYGYLKGLPVPE